MMVSVLMSVYKEKTRFLRESIESILNQTYKDFEFVIVGDSPPSDRDRVFSVVEEYALKDNRIIFLPNEENLGLTKSLNVGLSRCQGKYIARMDADDISVPSRLEKQVAFMEANPNILASSAWFEYLDENGNNIGQIARCQQSPQRIRLAILKKSVLGHPVSIFHRIINDTVVKYDESVTYAQDYSLWVWILQYGDMSNIQEVLLYYRKSDSQISTEHVSEQQECAKRAQRKAFELLYGFPYVKEFMDVFFRLTIGREKQVPEEEALKVYQDYLTQVKVTKKSYPALKFIMDIYIQYFSKKTPKRIGLFLYDLTKKNRKLMIISEMDYVCRRLLEIAKYRTRS